MPEELSFPLLMERLRAGDAGAADEVFRRFARRLIGLARRNLDGRLRRKVDPEDILQSAFRSFFRRHADEHFDLESWDSLWSLLALIALRKCGRQIEHFLAACRHVGREQEPATAGDSVASCAALAAEPTPVEAAVLAETVEQLLRGRPDEREREVVQLSLQGYSVAEISLRVGRSERTVQRVLREVRQWLERQRDGARGAV